MHFRKWDFHHWVSIKSVMNIHMDGFRYFRSRD